MIAEWVRGGPWWRRYGGREIRGVACGFGLGSEEVPLRMASWEVGPRHTNQHTEQRFILWSDCRVVSLVHYGQRSIKFLCFSSKVLLRLAASKVNMPCSINCPNGIDHVACSR